MARDTWYRLDNVGKFYSAQAGSSTQTVFRYSATMADDIDERSLQRALDRAIEAYPTFNVCLRSGMFWHYLEPSADHPMATRETLPLCYGLHAHAKSVLFRVTHFGARINLEVSHMVSDGRGSLDFMKALVTSYVEERYGVEGPSIAGCSTPREKSENSFDTYYEKHKAGPTKSPKVYRIQGLKNTAEPTFFEYHVSAGKVLAQAREIGVSLTSFVIAAVICAVRENMPARERNRAIRLNVPVDLRQFFESSTTKNFFGLAFVAYTPQAIDEPFEAVARNVQAQILEATKPDNLKRRMNQMIALEKNPFVRVTPLFAKDFALGIADRFSSKDVTTTVSSIGRISIDPRIDPYVRNINVLTSTTGLNFILCTFGDDLSIGISTVYANLSIPRTFCRFFSQRGIEGVVHTNRGATS